MSDTSYLSFQLSPNFIKKYENRDVNWGYMAPNGVSLGEITYVDKYARDVGIESGKVDPNWNKPDDEHEETRKEKWFECVKRVVEGAYSIQKDYCQKSHIPWSDGKAQYSAQEMYDIIFNFKMLPPGRGLWRMGSRQVYETGNSASLNNCFSGDTEFVTSFGSVKFSDVVGEEVSVLLPNGYFANAQVKNFGEQKLNEVIFKPKGLRSNLEIKIEVTPNHRWILSDGYETTNLKIGDSVKTAKNYQELDVTGFAHGLIFGDGTRHTYYPERHFIRLCGEKEWQHRDLLESIEGYVSTNYADNGDPIVTIVRKGENWKSLPYGRSAKYISSFIRGWIAADGHTHPSGSIGLDTSNAEAAEWIIKHAPFANYIATGHYTDNNSTNYGERRFPLNRISLSNKNVEWVVKDIRNTGKKEEVYCVVEPQTHSFTLAGGLITGNCGFVTTENINQNFAEPFIWTMEASMLGVGVGFDTRGAGKVEIKKPEGHFPYTIPDTREGWVRSVELLLEAYIYGSKLPCFNYDKIRPAGSPIRGFGGVASGPAPLIELHETLKDLFDGRDGEVITSRDIVDIMNLVGKCVVSGNVRRSAEIALGDFNDTDFFYIKDWTRPENRKRTDMDNGWAGMSNNSLIVTKKDEPDFDFLANHIAQTNGDPGLFWLEKAQKFGRMVDPPNWKDRRARGTNPCSEQTLEAFELCCLVETFPMKHVDLKDFFRTLKFAYLYAKSVTLLPTHWPKTNQIMKRNMRIGTSMSGLAQFVDNRGLMQLIDWMDKGYKEVQRRDEQYSEWLGVRPSIKTTSIKPSGTVSLLAGVTPGVHWPIAPTYIRRMRYADTNPLLPRLREAGYDMFWSNRDQAWVVDFPMKGPQVRSEFDVPVVEKVSLAAAAQKFWADNQVSATITFFADKPEELRDALELYSDDLKSISALTMSKNIYTETVDGIEYSIMPYESITDEEFEEKAYRLGAIDLSILYNSQEAAKGEAYCDSDVCEITF